MFIKHGDGKIMSIVENEELTETQKKAASNISKEIKKQFDKKSDASDSEQSGR